MTIETRLCFKTKFIRKDILYLLYHELMVFLENPNRKKDESFCLIGRTLGHKGDLRIKEDATTVHRKHEIINTGNLGGQKGLTCI